MTEITKQTFGFVAGEVSPSFYGRVDLTKYEMGLALSHNFYTDYRGGLVSRPGTEFVGPVEADDDVHRMFRFKAQGNDYLLVFGENYMRPVRNGGYLLETAKNISGIIGQTFTVTAHGLSDGDWIYVSGVVGAVEFNGRHFEIFDVTTNTFKVRRVNNTGLVFAGYGTYISGGTVARVVRIATPFAASDLRGLCLHQRNADVIITSLDFPPHKLTYVSNTNWTLTEIAFGSGVTRPAQPTLTPSSVGSAGVAFAVTAVVNDVESLASPYIMTSVSVNYSTTAGSMLVEWPAVSGASSYNVYRSLLLPTGTQISAAQELGFVGRANSGQFIDNNIVPDFTKTPPRAYAPFSNGQITYIAVTAGGTGYTNSSVVTVTDASGTGFIGQAVVDSSGELIGIVVLDGGKNYVAPSVSVSIGTGATFTCTLSGASGNYPRVFTMFQQRGVYAGSTNQPVTIWGTVPDSVSNFSLSTVPSAGDAYSLTLDGNDAEPLQHLVALRNGLLAFSASTITLIRAEEGKAVSGINAVAEPQAYKGASRAVPVKIDQDVLFIQANLSSLNALMYTENAATSQLQDISILSNHLMQPGRTVSRLEWAAEPNRLLWCLRSDGALLSVTYERPQEVFAWAQHWTQGFFTDICVVAENSSDVLYAIVRRKRPDGGWIKHLEVFRAREFENIEDYWGMDCALELPHTKPATTAAIEVTGSTFTLTTNAAVFSSGDVGKIVYHTGGKYEITAYVSTTEVTGVVLRESTALYPEVSNPQPVEANSGRWSMVQPVTSISNLFHLEGKEVAVLADGDVIEGLVVTDGEITLPRAASKVRVGLGYSCRAKTLPLTMNGTATEHRTKRVIAASVRLQETRGVALGQDFNDMVELKDRVDVDWGAAIPGNSTYRSAYIDGTYDEDGQCCIEQRYPLPATILGLVLEVDIGDE